MCIRDWSSDVCSSDLDRPSARVLRQQGVDQRAAFAAGLAHDRKDMLLLEQLLVIAFPESAEDRGGIRERRGVHPRRIGDQLGRCLAIDDQDAAKHTMFAHQVFVGGYFAFTAFRSEEHTSELQSPMRISY